MQVPEGNNYLMSYEQLLNKLAVLAGGRAAEEIQFGTITTGASNDIEQMTKLARSMIARYGMSDKFGMIAMETVDNRYLGDDTSLTASQLTAAEIDKEVISLVKAQYDKAYQILDENREVLTQLSEYLYEEETITGKQFMEILKSPRIDVTPIEEDIS